MARALILRNHLIRSTVIVLAIGMALPSAAFAVACPMMGEATNPPEPVGAGKPFTFGAGVKSRNLILRNPVGVIRRQFLNGSPEMGIPGVLSANEGGNFGLKAVNGAKMCGEALNGGEECEITITSAAAGKKGEYKLEYGAPASPNELAFEIKS